MTTPRSRLNVRCLALTCAFHIYIFTVSGQQIRLSPCNARRSREISLCGRNFGSNAHAQLWRGRTETLSTLSFLRTNPTAFQTHLRPSRTISAPGVGDAPRGYATAPQARETGRPCAKRSISVTPKIKKTATRASPSSLSRVSLSLSLSLV